MAFDCLDMQGAFVLCQTRLHYPAMILDQLHQEISHYLVQDTCHYADLCDTVLPRCSTAAGTSAEQAQLRRSPEL